MEELKKDAWFLLTEFWYLWVLCLVAYILSKFIPLIKGKIGEKSIALLLFDLSQKGYRLVNDVMLPTEKGTTQIDHIVVSIYGLFVIETKNYKGLIYGSETGNQWTQNIYGKKYNFKNPIHQNYGHIKALERLLSPQFPDIIYTSIVAVAGDAKLKVQATKSHVVYFGNVKKTIRSHKEKCLSEEQMVSIVKMLKENNIKDSAARKQHVKDIKDKKENAEGKSKAGIYPRCGRELVKRKGKYGEFIGCSGYPGCRYTEEKP